MEMSGKLLTLATLPQGKVPQYPLDRRLGGPQNILLIIQHVHGLSSLWFYVAVLLVYI